MGHHRAVGGIVTLRLDVQRRSTLGQVHADMGLALGMALRMGVPDLLHDGAEAGYIGERIWYLLNFVEKLAWDVQGGPVHQLCCTAA